MIPVGPDLAIAREQAVQRLRDADCEALHSFGERRTVFGLDDQVQVIALDRVMDDAHSEPNPGDTKRLFQTVPHALPPHSPDASDRPHRDVHRMMTRQLLPPQV